MAVERVMQNDVGKVFSDTLTIGAAAPPAGGEPWFLMQGPQQIAAQAQWVDESEGTVTYSTVADDLELPGLYRQQWEIRYVDGTKLSFPDAESVNWVDVIRDVSPPEVVSA
jgi:hypothetical protein